MTFSTIGIVGGGAWGTALAQTLRRGGCDVVLWAHEAQTVEDINARHENRNFLAGVALDPRIRATGELSEVAGCDAILLVTPAQHLRATISKLQGRVAPGTPAILCAKGIEQSSGKLMTQVLGETLSDVVPAVLSGPSFASEVARGLPTAVTLACADQALASELARALAHTNFRTYWSADLIGAEIGGAVKNVLAIAAGIVVGKKLGSNAHAALTTRGFSEMVRFGQALGARLETLAGLSGLGDLILTCGSPQSRNMSLGIALGEGRGLADILAARSSIAEGVYTASAVVEVARRHGIEMPVCEAVQRVVAGEAGVEESIRALLARPLRAEG